VLLRLWATRVVPSPMILWAPAWCGKPRTGRHIIPGAPSAERRVHPCGSRRPMPAVPGAPGRVLRGRPSAAPARAPGRCRDCGARVSGDLVRCDRCAPLWKREEAERITSAGPAALFQLRGPASIPPTARRWRRSNAPLSGLTGPPTWPGSGAAARRVTRHGGRGFGRGWLTCPSHGSARPPGTRFGTAPTSAPAWWSLTPGCGPLWSSWPERADGSSAGVPRSRSNSG